MNKALALIKHSLILNLFIYIYSKLLLFHKKVSAILKSTVALVLKRDWFQDLPQILKSKDAQVPYMKWHSVDI